MRDLRRYPITFDEIEDCLIDLADKLLKEESIGDMRPLLLRTAARVLKRLDFAVLDVLKMESK